MSTVEVIAVVTSSGVVLLIVVIVLSKLDRLEIVTVANELSSEVIALEKSLAEETFTLFGLTSNFCRDGSVESNVNSETVSVVLFNPTSLIVGKVVDS